MNKFLKSYFGGIMFLPLMCCCSGQSDDPGNVQTDKDTLVNLNASQSFSLLSISADKGLVSGSYNPQSLATFIQDKNPDVVAMQDVDFRTTDVGGKDLVSEIAYLSSKGGQPRQGIFTPISKVNGGERGLGFLVRDCFTGTRRLLLNNVLVLHTMNYALKSGQNIVIATCQFDRNNETVNQKQAEALVAYADTVKSNVVVAASIHGDIGSNVMNTIEKKFRRSCRSVANYTYPASGPAKRYDYILTPLSQKWGTQLVQVTGSSTISDHLGILIRIGLK